MAVLIISALINSICVKHQVLSVTLCNATARGLYLHNRRLFYAIPNMSSTVIVIASKQKVGAVSPVLTEGEGATVTR